MMRGTFTNPCRHTNPGLAISGQLSLQILLEDDSPSGARNKLQLGPAKDGKMYFVPIRIICLRMP